MNLTKHWAGSLDDYAIDLAWSPDGRFLAAASAAGAIQLFRSQDGQRLHTLPGHEDGTNCLAWKPGSEPILASGGQDGAVKMWDAQAGQHLTTAKLGSAWVEHLAWRPAGSASTTTLLAAGAGKELVFLTAEGGVRHRCKPTPKSLAAIAWQPAGGCLAAAHFGGITLWDADDFISQKEYAYTNGIHALVWSPDNRWLVSGNQDPSVHLWLPEEDQEFHMSGYEGKVKELAFDRTGRWLATGGGRDACIWDCEGAGPEGREPAMLPHDAKVCGVTFQHRFGLLATAAEDGSVALWSPERKQPLRATVRMPSAPSKLAWSPDDRNLAIGSAQGVVYVLKCED